MKSKSVNIKKIKLVISTNSVRIKKKNKICCKILLSKLNEISKIIEIIANRKKFKVLKIIKYGCSNLSKIILKHIKIATKVLNVCNVFHFFIFIKCSN